MLSWRVAARVHTPGQTSRGSAGQDPRLGPRVCKDETLPTGLHSLKNILILATLSSAKSKFISWVRREVKATNACWTWIVL